jgi:predicted nucleic acid-binding protein
MRADFTVLLDANVLAESAISDLFLRLSEEPRLICPKWTHEIWEETHRTLINKLNWPEATAASRIKAAQEAFPEALIEDFEGFIEKCTNDPKDRHILAAAIRAKVETIVTMNVKHFKSEDLEPWGVTAAHPGDYLKVLYDLDEGVVVSVLHRMAELRGKSISDMLSRLSAAVPTFTAYVASDLGLEVPPYSRPEWRP